MDRWVRRNGVPVKVEDIGSEPSEFPEPEWYVEQFRSHVSTIHELFKACPPQQWKTLSLAIGDALGEAGEKVGLKVDRYVQTEDIDMSRKEKRFGKG